MERKDYFQIDAMKNSRNNHQERLDGCVVGPLSSDGYASCMLLSVEVKVI